MSPDAQRNGPPPSHGEPLPKLSPPPDDTSRASIARLVPAARLPGEGGVSPGACWRCGVTFALTTLEDLARCARLAQAGLYHRGPCHPCPCGLDECYVLTWDGEHPPPEIHVCPRFLAAGTAVR